MSSRRQLTQGRPTRQLASAPVRRINVDESFWIDRNNYVRTIEAAAELRVVMHGDSAHIATELAINWTLDSPVLYAASTRYQQ